jgi:hypothetical protein
MRPSYRFGPASLRNLNVNLFDLAPELMSIFQGESEDVWTSEIRTDGDYIRWIQESLNKIMGLQHTIGTERRKSRPYHLHLFNVFASTDAGARQSDTRQPDRRREVHLFQRPERDRCPAMERSRQSSPRPLLLGMCTGEEES